MCLFSLISFVTVTLVTVSGLPTNQQRIVGGSETNIQNYPFSAALLRSQDFIIYQHKCGGTIVNNRSVLTAARCVHGDAPIRWQIRVGSSFANSGGIVSNTILITVNPNYNVATQDSDIALVRSGTTFVMSTTVAVAAIASATSVIPDDVIVQAIGWGATRFEGTWSETLRHVQVWTINQATCRNRYAGLEQIVSENMICTGWLDVGGYDQCTGDDGSPIIYNNVIIGVRSWGMRCGLARYPGVNTRVSSFTTWISANV